MKTVQMRNVSLYIIRNPKYKFMETASTPNTLKEKLKNAFYLVLFLGGISLLIHLCSGNNSSNSSSTSGSKTCSYCGKSFSNKGYYHIGTRCEQESGNGWEGRHCSARCCDDDWSKNGIHSH
jgi:hypothetical protein